MDKNVRIIESGYGFVVKQGPRTYRPTRALYELAALLELVDADYVSWRFLGNMDDPEVLDGATEVIQHVGMARARLQRLQVPETGALELDAASSAA